MKRKEKKKALASVDLCTDKNSHHQQGKHPHGRN